MNRYGGYDDREFVAEFYDITYDTARPQDISFFVDYAQVAGNTQTEVK